MEEEKFRDNGPSENTTELLVKPSRADDLLMAVALIAETTLNVEYFSCRYKVKVR